MSAQQIGITVTIIPETQEQSRAVIERMALILTGLALEGIVTSMAVTPYETDADEE